MKKNRLLDHQHWHNVTKLLPKYILEAPPSNLTLEERAALYNYTGVGYATLNKQLRTNTLDNEHQLFAKALINAHYKLPPERCLCYRGTSRLYFPAFEVGDTVAADAFWSFSKSEQVAIDQEGDAIGVIFVLYTENAKSIARFSQYFEEDEVLVIPGTIFEVVFVHQAPTGRHYYGIIEKQAFQ